MCDPAFPPGGPTLRFRPGAAAPEGGRSCSVARFFSVHVFLRRRTSCVRGACTLPQLHPRNACGIVLLCVTLSPSRSARQRLVQARREIQDRHARNRTFRARHGSTASPLSERAAYSPQPSEGVSRPTFGRIAHNANRRHHTVRAPSQQPSMCDRADTSGGSHRRVLAFQQFVQ